MAAVVDGAELILSVPDDVLALISAEFRPGDLLALAAASRRLHAAVSAADKPWLAQCRRLLPSSLSQSQLLAGRAAAGGSYLAVYRFLHSVSPLRGLWASENPELGNLVAAFPGFLSIVAVRAIPQELSPRLLWAPVFEILADAHGRPALLFLHGHHPGSLFPGLLAPLSPHADMFLLEAHAPVSSSPTSQFPCLSFGERRRLLDALVASCRLTLPPDLSAAPLFARSDEDIPVLAARREAMLRLHAESEGGVVGRPELEALLPLPTIDAAGEKVYAGSKHLPLDEFLRASESVGLSLRGARMRPSTYHGWPRMRDNQFALYKLTTQTPLPGREYAGLWGGTFGWPPSSLEEDECKPGKALFFLLLSYEQDQDNEGKLLLTATKVLEGTGYARHPNGSSMFDVRVGEPSTDAFPWSTEAEGSLGVDIETGFAGEGISGGYGFRYPGSTPGSLFALRDGRLAFVWRDSKSVLTLQRLNLEELLRKGERVPALPLIPNFAYLETSYSNVFVAVIDGGSSCSSSATDRSGT